MDIKKIQLKKVITKDAEKDIEVEVIPFNKRKDEHVEFVYNYVDMSVGSPSPFKTMNDVARSYVRLFMVHKEEDEKKEESNYSLVLSDLRACRTLLLDEKFQKDVNDFFGLA